MDWSIDKAGRVLITVAGQIGSGKTAVSREISGHTGWKMISAGGILRSMAVEHGMSVLEFNEYAKSHHDIDSTIDNYLSTLTESPESLIIDSRMAWHFLPSSRKVYLVVDEVVGAKRVFEASRTDENHESQESALQENVERQRLERERFLSLYSVHAEDWRNYNLVIDTTEALPGTVADVVLNHVKGCAVEPAGQPECWIALKRLIPTQNISELATTRAQDIWADAQRDGFRHESTLDIALYAGSLYIIDGHVRTSVALRLRQPLVKCRLIALGNEDVLPGVKLREFISSSTSMSVINAWEDANDFHMLAYPKGFGDSHRTA